MTHLCKECAREIKLKNSQEQTLFTTNHNSK